MRVRISPARLFYILHSLKVFCGIMKYKDVEFIRLSEIVSGLRDLVESFTKFRQRPLPYLDGEYVEDAVFIEDYEQVSKLQELSENITSI